MTRIPDRRGWWRRVTGDIESIVWVYEEHGSSRLKWIHDNAHRSAQGAPVVDDGAWNGVA